MGENNIRKITLSKEELGAYTNVSEEEKDRRAHEIEDIFLGVLEYELEKEHTDPVTLDLLKKANIIEVD